MIDDTNLLNIDSNITQSNNNPTFVKKVFVSGCFDMLHSGHVQFFLTAAQYGDLYVSIGNDANLKYLKNKTPVYNQEERLFMIKALSCVKEAFIAKGMGIMDFLDELEEIKPNIFIVNEDGHSVKKEKIIKDLGIEYVVLKREPAENLIIRSTSSLRRLLQENHFSNLLSGQKSLIPYRIDLCGGWLDQPFVSKLCSGSVITFPIYGLPYEFRDKNFNSSDLKDTIEFSHRSGMATSTRNSAIELWGSQIGFGQDYKLAKMLFRYNNPPGIEHISGSQDAIGIVVPGISKSFYVGDYWPEQIDTIKDDQTIKFLEEHICLLPLQPRFYGYNPLGNSNVNIQDAQALSEASRQTWSALKNFDLEALGRGVTAGFRAQVALFPNMADEYVLEFINDVVARHGDNILGYKLSGAGGGGYMICIVKKPIVNSVIIKIPKEIIR